MTGIGLSQPAMQVMCHQLPAKMTTVCRQDDWPLISSACAGIVPSLVQMFLVFPLSTPFRIGGVGLGALTPVFVLIFNTIGWGIPAYAWFRLAGGANSTLLSCHSVA